MLRSGHAPRMSPSFLCSSPRRPPRPESSPTWPRRFWRSWSRPCRWRSVSRSGPRRAPPRRVRRAREAVAALRRIAVLLIEPHDAAFRLRIEHEPRAHGRALPGRRGGRHRGAFRLALRHQSRGLRLDRAAAGRSRARRAVAAERARPCRHQRLRERRFRPLSAPPTAGAVRRRAGDGAGLYRAPTRGGDAAAGLHPAGGRSRARVAVARNLHPLAGALGAVAMARRPRQRHRGSGMRARVIRHLIIRGRVQGVGYRAFAEYTAFGHGLAGWVRNRRDGAVEAVLAGPAAAVARVVEAYRRGPPGARVDSIDERNGTPDELALSGGERFAVLPTA